MLGHFGGQDRGIATADVEKFSAALRKQGLDVDFKIYPAQGHAFMNQNAKQGYDEAASADAWSRIFTFLKTKV